MGQIAVILNYKEEVDSFVKGNKIAIFQEDNEKWIKMREIELALLDDNSAEFMTHMRKFIHDLVAELHDCKVLVGTVITGLPYMLFDQAGFILCETNNISNELLHIIWKDYETGKQNIENTENTQTNEDYPSAPYEIQCGIYEFDLRKLRTVHPEISSKMALIPFLKNKRFSRLDIYCDHIMPWIERELSAWGMKYQSKRLGQSGYKIEIIHFSS